MVRRGTSLFALLASAIAIGAGCSLMKSFDGFTPADPGCPLRSWPERPHAAPGGTNKLYGATKAMSPIDSAGVAVGLDLDGLCTCPDRGACVNGRATTPSCDIAGGGIDNKSAEFLNALRLTEKELTDGVLHGRHGLAIKIEGYNGRKDDPDVIVSIYNVVGVGGRTDGSTTATFDGEDTFIADEASTAGDLVPRYVATNAYVSGGVLVAELDFDLRLVNLQQGVPVVVVEPLKNARLVGRIDDARNGGFRMREALLVGRIPLSTMFSRAGPGSSCSDAGLFEGFLNQVCGQLDLPAGEEDDGRERPCGALSFGVRMEIVPAVLSPTAVAVASDPPCPSLKDACR